MCHFNSFRKGSRQMHWIVAQERGLRQAKGLGWLNLSYGFLPFLFELPESSDPEGPGKTLQALGLALGTSWGTHRLLSPRDLPMRMPRHSVRGQKELRENKLTRSCCHLSSWQTVHLWRPSPESPSHPSAVDSHPRVDPSLLWLKCSLHSVCTCLPLPLDYGPPEARNNVL